MTKKMVKVLLIDPPSGWRYGFPKLFIDNDWGWESKSIETWLRENGYPEHELEKGMAKYCRFIESEMEEEALDTAKLRLNVPTLTRYGPGPSDGDY